MDSVIELKRICAEMADEQERDRLSYSHEGISSYTVFVWQREIEKVIEKLGGDPEQREWLKWCAALPEDKRENRDSLPPLDEDLQLGIVVKVKGILYRLI